MTDSNLVHVLGRQTQGRVGLVAHRTVSHGATAIAQEFDRLHGDGCVAAIVDAIDDADLMAIGHAAADLKLVTGGSGVAMGLPDNFRRAGLLTAKGAADALDPVEGLEAVIAGSCSAATIGQVAEMGGTHPMFRVDPAALAAGEDVAGAALDWAAAKLAKGPVLIYSTDQPDAVAAVQGRLGRDEAGALVEDAMANIARGLADAGVRKLVVAGGETSGAVVQALGVAALRIGPEIDPGVPWTQSLGDPPIALALKSGNFGAPDFFVKALRMLT